MIIAKYPKISCLVITRGRAELFRHSLNCYMNQTYSNRNLVVVSQGSESENYLIKKCLENVPDVIFETTNQQTSLGHLRNLSVDLATGEIVCQWDDDDYYHPWRLQRQYDALRSCSNHVASIYSKFLKYFKNEHKLYYCDWSGESSLINRYLCGSIMFHKDVFKSFPMFYPQTGPQSKVEEDLHVLDKLLIRGSIAAVQSGFDYLYCYHGHNIYDLAHHKLTLNTDSGKLVGDQEFLIKNKDAIETSLQDMGFVERVAVCSNEKTVFDYPENL